MNLRFQCETVRRYLVVVAACLWLGGFTFYSVVVIHTAHHVLDSMLETGLITQQVSGWLNLIGAGALLIFLWDVLVLWRGQKIFVRVILLIMWMVMGAMLVWLFLLHPVIDRQINLETRHLVDRQQFRGAHTLYVSLSTVQWAAGLIYLFCTLHAWRFRDQSAAAGQPSTATPAAKLSN